MADDRVIAAPQAKDAALPWRISVYKLPRGKGRREAVRHTCVCGPSYSPPVRRPLGRWRFAAARTFTQSHACAPPGGQITDPSQAHTQVVSWGFVNARVAIECLLRCNQ